MVLFSFFVKPRIHERMFGTFLCQGGKNWTNFFVALSRLLVFQKDPIEAKILSAFEICLLISNIVIHNAVSFSAWHSLWMDDNFEFIDRFIDGWNPSFVDETTNCQRKPWGIWIWSWFVSVIHYWCGKQSAEISLAPPQCSSPTMSGPLRTLHWADFWRLVM